MVKFCKDCSFCKIRSKLFPRCYNEEFVPVKYFASYNVDDLPFASDLRQDIEACGPSGRNWKPKWWKFWLWFNK